jgi:hypothetical protein
MIETVLFGGTLVVVYVYFAPYSQGSDIPGASALGALLAACAAGHVDEVSHRGIRRMCSFRFTLLSLIGGPDSIYTR